MDEQTNMYDPAPQQYDPAPQQQPIESASGTTSPDNGNSGPFAYIVTAICVVLLMLLSGAATGCVRDTISLALGLADSASGNVQINVTIPEEEVTIDDIDFDDVYGNTFEDYFYEVFGVPYPDTDSRDRSDRDRTRDRSDRDTEADTDADDQTTYPPLEVLSLSLSIYDDTVNDLVSANAYAGSDADVREFTRTLVIADRDATKELISELRAAGRDGEDYDAAIKAAKAIASDMLDTLDSAEAPDTDETTGAYLDEGLERVEARWEAIDSLLDLLETGDDVLFQDLVDVDNAVYQNTIEAADALEAALAASAK